MATLRRIIGIGIFVLVVVFNRTEARALPQGKVTQSGEPSHFQVDDKAAEIEVNANPAGVKVNAKPASLQVVAKPGAPAIPVYHPAIHVAPHYLPPRLIHREPAMYFHHHRHCFPYCLGTNNNGWFYSGLRRNQLPKPSSNVGMRRGKLSKNGIELSRRNAIPDIPDVDEDGQTISRGHKSSIPRPLQHKGKSAGKRQFIAAVPQMYQPLGIGAFGNSGYGVQPYASMATTRAPLARNLISSLGRAPSNNVLGSLGMYGANALSTLAGYGQPMSNNVPGLPAPQFATNGLGMFGTYGGQLSNFAQQSPSYGLGQRKPDPINKFIQEELNHEMHSSAAAPSALGMDQGYSRSVINSPYTQASGLQSLVSGRSMSGAGGLYGSVLGSSALGYGAGLTGYSNPALMQLAQMYAAQLTGMQGLTTPGLQQYAQPRTVLPWLPYQSMVAAGRSPLVGRSRVPGSKNVRKDKNENIIEDGKDSNKHQGETKVDEKKEANFEKKKLRRKRQLLFDPDDGGDYGLSYILQNALVNEVKRQMILGTPQPDLQQLASLRDETPAMRIPLPGLQQAYEAAQQQTQNPFLQQLPLNNLGADYISPFDNYGPHSMMASPRAPLNALALSRSQLPQDQLRMMPTLQRRMPMMSPREPMRQYQGAQSLNPNRPNEYIGSPMFFSAGYRSPVQYEQTQPPKRRKYGRHPLYRRRLRRPHPRFDDAYDDDENDDDEYGFNQDREMYHGEHLGKGTVSLGGSYSEDEMPSDRGETLVDTTNHGFGPITVEAKTAEGARSSLGEDRRSNVAKPGRIQEDPSKESDTELHNGHLKEGIL